ncbi:MAG: hypothetical protein Q8M31_00830 [Beijerinckiaceae bacterium]|nr:hypothetical protein [Beijerinckiaceae bacterium]
MRTIFTVTALLATISTPSAGYVDTPQCRRDLATTEASFSATLRDLERNKSSVIAQRCPSFRRHVEVMRKASGVFRKCSTGRERQENVGQMDGSIADFLEIIARHCR